jgi:hypothetical protein
VNSFPCGNGHLSTNPSFLRHGWGLFLGAPQGDHFFAFSPISTRRCVASYRMNLTL